MIAFDGGTSFQIPDIQVFSYDSNGYINSPLTKNRRYDRIIPDNINNFNMTEVRGVRTWYNKSHIVNFNTIVNKPIVENLKDPISQKKLEFINEKCFDIKLSNSGDIDENVTILIKSFLRPDHVKRLIISIRSVYPTIKIVVVDDSEKGYNFDIDENINTYEIPYDSGLAYGRNYGLKKIKTTYFLLCDDDFLFNENTNIQKLFDIISKSDLDILGGDVYEGKKRTNYFGLLDRKEDILYYNKGNRGIFEDYILYDLILNFFIAKTEKIREYGWDNELKLAEHTAFFYDNKDNLKVGHTQNISISHQNKTNNNEYFGFRKRGNIFFKIWNKKRGIKTIINNLN